MFTAPPLSGSMLTLESTRISSSVTMRICNGTVSRAFGVPVRVKVKRRSPLDLLWAIDLFCPFVYLQCEPVNCGGHELWPVSFRPILFVSFVSGLLDYLLCSNSQNGTGTLCLFQCSQGPALFVCKQLTKPYDVSSKFSKSCIVSASGFSPWSRIAPLPIHHLWSRTCISRRSLTQPGTLLSSIWSKHKAAKLKAAVVPSSFFFLSRLIYRVPISESESSPAYYSSCWL